MILNIFFLNIWCSKSLSIPVWRINYSGKFCPCFLISRKTKLGSIWITSLWEISFSKAIPLKFYISLVPIDKFQLYGFALERNKALRYGGLKVLNSLFHVCKAHMLSKYNCPCGQKWPGRMVVFACSTDVLPAWSSKFAPVLLDCNTWL